MRKANVCEDDMLEVYGDYLQSKDFILFSLSGNQQGRFWYSIENFRKGPDIVAVKGNMALIGEGKLKSRDLFLKNVNGFSDYQAMKYLLDSPKAYSQLIEKIKISCEKVGITFPEDGYIKGVIVGGDPFEELLPLMDDKRVGHAYVDICNVVVKEVL